MTADVWMSVALAGVLALMPLSALALALVKLSPARGRGPPQVLDAAIVEVDPHGLIHRVEVARAGGVFAGLQRARGAHLSAFVADGVDRQRLQRYIAILTRGQVRQAVVELSLQLSDAPPVRCVLHGTARFNVEMQLDGFAGLIMAQPAHLRAEWAHGNAPRWLEDSDTAVLHLDREDLVVDASPGAAVLLRCASDELLGRSLEDLVQWSETESDAGTIEAVAGRPRSALARRPDGSRFQAEIFVVATGSEALSERLLIFSDVSRRERAVSVLKTRGRHHQLIAGLGDRALWGMRLNELLRHALQDAMRELGADCGHIMLRQQGALVHRAAIGWSHADAVPATWELTAHSLGKRALRSTEPQWIESLREVMGARLPAELARHHLHSGILAAIPSPTGTFGMVALYWRGQVQPAPHEIDFLRTQVRLLGVAVARERSEAESHRAARALESAREAVLILDADGRVYVVNSAFERLTGRPADATRGTLLTDLLAPVARRDVFWERAAQSGEWEGEVAMARADGSQFPSLMSISAVQGGEHERPDYVAVFNDLAPLQRYEEQLKFLAAHDSLTGLPNRIQFRERCADSLARARRSAALFGVLYIDLDNFKHINDSLGHAMGDDFLRVVGQRLRAQVRATDTVARLGGDEFAILAEGIDRKEDLTGLADKVLAALSTPFRLGEVELYSSASIGIATYPHDGADVEELLKHADTAMYRAKSDGRNGYQYYAGEMNTQVVETLVMANSLRGALERGEFELHYQPIISLDSGRPEGFEALLRWRHPQLGMVMPDDFIPFAEESGIINQVGAWVLREALAEGVFWHQRGHRMKVSVNLSARQLRHADFVHQMRSILDELGFPASYLKLEITESVIMEQYLLTRDLLAQVADMGVQLIIDDFGTGYSSLSHLKQLPIHGLKIDRLFVRDIPEDDDDTAIVRAIIALAGSLGLELVAEGVETPAQQDFLRTEGCTLAQGYLYGRPQSARLVRQLLSAEGVIAADFGRRA